MVPMPEYPSAKAIDIEMNATATNPVDEAQLVRPEQKLAQPA
jgi:hypothetical protein